MLEIRIHGRGGQGAVVASKVLAAAFFGEGHFVQAFPAFGVERRGAPVMAFVRIDSAPVRLRCNVYNPEHLIVLDHALTETVDITAWEAARRPWSTRRSSELSRAAPASSNSIPYSRPSRTRSRSSRRPTGKPRSTRSKKR